MVAASERTNASRGGVSVRRPREELGLIWVGDWEQWKLREGSGRADQAARGQRERSAAAINPKIGVLGSGGRRRREGGNVWSVVLHFGPPIYLIIWTNHFELGRLSR